MSLFGNLCANMHIYAIWLAALCNILLFEVFSNVAAYLQ